MGKPLDSLKKLGSKLRCVANGDSFVNDSRSKLNGAVRKLEPAKPAKRDRTEIESYIAQQDELRRAPRAKKGPPQTALPDDVEVNVFTLFDDDRDKTPAIVQRRSGRIGIASVKLSQLKDLDRLKSIRSIELAESLKAPDVVTRAANQPPPERRPLMHIVREGGIVIKESKARGKGVLIGIIDVGGIDFAHQDFLDDQGNSRVFAIWDQGGDTFAPPKLPIDDANLSVERAVYGSEITQKHIKLAIDKAGSEGLSPHDLAPQSQRLVGSHATHVASIAAGRSGLCPEATIAAVMISLPRSDLDRRKSFYDTRCVMDAISYILKVGRTLRMPVSINISLGTNGGAHDGSELPSRWIDSMLSVPGRSICVAAGNSGQDRALFEGDLGFWSGRVHTSGRIAASKLRHDIDWVVTGDGWTDVSENEVEIWYSASDTFQVELRTPDGLWIGPVGSRSRVENLMLKSNTFVSIYNEISDPKNGDNKISIFLSPYLRKKVIGVQAGTWRIRLTGSSIRDGHFHAWIERDDPQRVGPGSSSYWSLPSYFGEHSYVDDSTVSSLACGPNVIAVANMDDAAEQINASSSQGPTRDGRSKPDIAAPGTNIRAANGFDPDELWIDMTGTSMASPYVAGVAGLMLSINSKLTAAQIAGMMQRTSQPLPGVTYSWDNAAGFGRINPQFCLDQVVVNGKPVRDLTSKLKKSLRQ